MSKKDLPTDFDYKFAEQTIEAYQAIYERTGEFLPETALKRLAREIKKMGKQTAQGVGLGIIVAACLYLPLMKGM